MKLNITIGCSICGFNQKMNIELPFNCDDYTCPKCGGCNCLSIISTSQYNQEKLPQLYSLNDLMKIRQF